MTRPAWRSPAREPNRPAFLDEAGPVLIPGERVRMIADLRRRIATFTPEWRRLTDEDAGVALVRLFGEQLDQVLARLERLPEKALVDFLSTAGVSLRPARPARAVVTFEAAATAPGPVVVPAGFQLTSAPADGSEDDVVWETDGPLTVHAARIAEVWTFDGETRRDIDPAFTAAFAGLGDRPKPGAELLIGLEAAQLPRGELTLAVEAARSGAPAPAAAGGPPVAARPAPALRWEALTDTGFVPAEVTEDATDKLRADGLVTLRASRTWHAGRPAGLAEGPALFWLRLHLRHGGYAEPPRLAALRLNAVSVTAAETVRDEFPEPLGGRVPRFRLSQTPVQPGTAVIEVDEGGAADLFAIETSAAPGTETFRRWQEVETLAGRRPDERVFTLDPASGVITFGDDVEGMRPPEGRRVVLVRAYRLAAGRASAVEAEAITVMRRTVPHLARVTNPRPAEGGSDAETRDSAVARGPAEIKARGRAVTERDIELMALDAEGADVARAFARSGADPAFPGAAMPGSVAVYVLPTRRPGDPSTDPPVPSPAALKAVAQHLATRVGPLGARVVCAAPRFHEVGIETTILIEPETDAGAAVTAVLEALDAYLDPYTGGEQGTGWRLGAPLRHARLVRRVLDASPAVRAVPYLNIVRDRLRFDLCADVGLAADGLPWPVGHQVVATPEAVG